MKRIRILLADDHAMVRAGIRALLEKQSELVVVGEAQTGGEALELAKHEHPDILLVDIAMPEMNGLEVVRQLAKDLPDVRCIILTMHADEEHVWQALQAGAAGYLIKGSSLGELELAIKAVSQGKPYLSPGVSGPIIREYIRRTGNDEGSSTNLTARQHEILRLIAEGKTTKQMAFLLGVSIKTVESHRTLLMKRLGVNDIASLVKHALKIGLVQS